MLKSKILQPEDYDRFLAFNKKNSGASVSDAYVLKAVIRVFYNDPDHWVAAYAVNTTPPFRYLSVLTIDQRTDLLRQHGISEANLAEITLLSRDRSLSWTHKNDREFYYTMSLLDALRTGRQYILGGTIKEKLADAQMEVLDQLLYKGELNFFGDSEYGWLYYASWFRAVQNAIGRAYRLVRKQPRRVNARSRKPRPTAPD